MRKDREERGRWWEGYNEKILSAAWTFGDSQERFDLYCEIRELKTVDAQSGLGKNS